MMASKRIGDTNADDYNKRSKVDDDSLQEIRVLVENTEAGCIIGKGGSNVQKIRSESGGFVSILKNEIPSAKERVMVLKGTVEANAHAVHLISQLLIDAGKNRQDQGATDTCTINVLIHKFLAGCIIGKQGSIIKELKERTGAHIRLSNEPLPGSTEKTVTITGSADVVRAASLSIFTQLSNNPLKTGSTTVLFVPGVPMYPGAEQGYGAPSPYGGRYPGNMMGGGPPGYGQQMPPQYGGQHGSPHGGYGGQQHGSPHGGYGGQQHGSHHGGYGGQQHGSQHGGYGQQHGGYGGQQYGAPSGYGGHGGGMDEQKTEKIVIPTVCAGIVIGKGGTAISDIKAQSGCHVSIAAPEPSAPGDRVVTIKGSKHGIHTAIYLIRQRVDAYQPRE